MAGVKAKPVPCSRHLMESFARPIEDVEQTNWRGFLLSSPCCPEPLSRSGPSTVLPQVHDLDRLQIPALLQPAAQGPPSPGGTQRLVSMPILLPMSGLRPIVRRHQN